MDNIGQIVYETIRISIPEFIRLAFAGTAGGLIGAYVNDRLTRKRDKETGIDKDRKPLIIAIDQMIDNVRNIDNPSLIVNYLHRLYAPYSAFRYHVTCKRLIAYNEAWEAVRRTSNEELQGNSPSGSYGADDKELKRLQQIIISRLEKLRKVADEIYFSGFGMLI